MRFNRHRNNLVGKLLLMGDNKPRFWFALLTLFIGLCLFMVSVLACWDLHQLLNDDSSNNSAYSFLTVARRIDKDPIGGKGLSFTGREIEELRYAPQVAGVAEMIPNSFKLKMRLGDSVLSTPLTVETVDSRFIDNTPVDWYWEPTSPSVPVIIPRDLQSLYNFNFSSSRSLFPLSDEMVKNLALKFIVGDSGIQRVYNATIVGFSDRIASILVPDSFMIINERIFGRQPMAPSRLILKVKDPSNSSFVHYLQRNNYTTNTEALHWNKVLVVSGWSGKILLLVVGLMFIACITAFLFFIFLTIFQASKSVAILLRIGYNTAYLIRYIYTRYIALLVLVALPVVILMISVQSKLASIAKLKQVHLPGYPGFQVWLALAAAMIILVFLLITITIRFVNRAAQGSSVN